MINSERLADLFLMLVKISSVSGTEKAVSERIAEIAEDLGGQVYEDESAEVTGSDTGNLVIKFPGTVDAPPLLLSAHMDTVEPGVSVSPILENGKFYSDGSTILGADDKSAIAIILETISVMQEQGVAYSPLELVLTTCEEVGLKGAKYLDFNLVSAKYGYALDTSDTEGIVIRAPAANRIEVKIHGKDAHAGVAPESGVNAITLASKAIAGIELGRIDHETTCNIGMIQGGVATNIVPSLVIVKGEVRSHSNEKLDSVTQGIVSAFQAVVDEYRSKETKNNLPSLEVMVEKDFPLTNIAGDHKVVQTALHAAENLGRKLELKATGGGSDANIFYDKGIMTCVLGTGMQDMHTLRESILLEDMVKTARLLMEIIKLHATPLDG